MKRHIDTQTIKHNIEDQIEKLKDLHKRLTDEGDPLSPEDRKLLKVAMLPLFEGVMDETKFSYLTGNTRFFDENIIFLNQFQKFMD